MNFLQSYRNDPLENYSNQDAKVYLTTLPQNVNQMFLLNLNISE